jgi:2-dehydrotetronate isomerase
MPKFAANLSMMYTEHAFMARFAAAARDGFKAVEFLFPYEFDAAHIAEQLAANGLEQVLFNLPPGDWAAGERGIACLPGREAEFRASVPLAISYAKQLKTPRVHIMAGLVPASASTPERNAMRATYIRNLRFAADELAEHGLEGLIEPINTRDIPGYFLNRQDHAHELLDEVGAANLHVQMDVYHCQIVEGDVAMKLRKYLPTGRVGHLQIASVPERHEPDSGELNYVYLFKLIDELGYTGWVGCEYRPRVGTAGGTSAGLGWLSALR